MSQQQHLQVLSQRRLCSFFCSTPPLMDRQISGCMVTKSDWYDMIRKNNQFPAVLFVFVSWMSVKYATGSGRTNGFGQLKFCTTIYIYTLSGKDFSKGSGFFLLFDPYDVKERIYFWYGHFRPRALAVSTAAPTVRILWTLHSNVAFWGNATFLFEILIC